jgi:hypothetical protein
VSLEQGCRERLAQSEDGRQALKLLDEWEQRVALLELVRGICELRTGAYRSDPLCMLAGPPMGSVRPWRELGFVEICATLGVEWMPNEWRKLELLQAVKAGR